MSRKTAREAAFKTIFEIPFHTDAEIDEIIKFNLSNYSFEPDQKKDTDYFENTVRECWNNLDKIDSEISSHLKTWSIERISKINISILRLAMAEILYIDDIPYQVSINEAVELAKKFGDDDSPAFINGVLASVI